MSNHLGTGTNTTFARGENRCTRLRGHQLQPIHQRVLPHAHYVLLLLSCCFLKLIWNLVWEQIITVREPAVC